jgi:hypothetical protein
MVTATMSVVLFPGPSFSLCETARVAHPAVTEGESVQRQRQRQRRQLRPTVGIADSLSTSMQVFEFCST